MKQSKYNVVSNVADETIIYNVLHQKMLRIPTNLFVALTAEKQSPALLQIGKKLQPFFVESDVDEQLHREYLDNCLRYQSSRLNITLMMTLECNFRCVYCFEHSVMQSKEVSSMNLSDEKFVSWVVSVIKKYSISEVSLCFHGGEPLLEIEKIRKIADRLIPFFEDNHIFYQFTMVSNGYLLSEKVVQDLLVAKVDIIQITIDGIKEVHDARRKLRNGEGSFDTIVSNLRNLNGRITTYLNVVFESKNYVDVCNLIDYLVEEQLKDAISLINFSPTKPSYRDGEVVFAEQDKKCEAEAMLTVIKYALTRGLRMANCLTYQLCTAKQKSSFVVLPDGSMYKCISGVGEKRFYLGEMDPAVDPYAFFVPATIRRETSCTMCKYGPICNHNCLYESHLYGRKVCNREYFGAFLPEYIKILASDLGHGIVMNPEAEEWRREYTERGSLYV